MKNVIVCRPEDDIGFATDMSIDEIRDWCNGGNAWLHAYVTLETGEEIRLEAAQ